MQYIGGLADDLGISSDNPKGSPVLHRVMDIFAMVLVHVISTLK